MDFTIVAGLSNLLSVGRDLFIDNKTRIGDLVIDATHSESINYSNEITDHPIGSGASISDHIYAKPTVLKLEGSIIDSSIDIIGTSQNVIDLFNGNLFTNVANKIQGLSTKERTAYEVLKALNANKQPVTVVTALDSFENMAIETLTFPRDQETNARLLFQIMLKQVTYVNVERVFISGNRRPTRDLISDKLNFGTQQTESLTTRENAATGSALANWLGL